MIRASSDGRCGGLGGDSERSRCSAAEGRAGAVAGERATSKNYLKSYETSCKYGRCDNDHF